MLKDKIEKLFEFATEHAEKYNPREVAAFVKKAHSILAPLQNKNFQIIRIDFVEKLDIIIVIAKLFGVRKALQMYDFRYDDEKPGKLFSMKELSSPSLALISKGIGKNQIAAYLPLFKKLITDATPGLKLKMGDAYWDLNRSGLEKFQKDALAGKYDNYTQTDDPHALSTFARNG